MKNLLRKEIKLCLNPQLVIFLFFSAFMAIPSWPALIAFVYPLSCLSTLFPRALADHDITYTAMLPIKKSDVVKGKVTLVVLLEIFSLVVAIPFAFLKMLVISPLSAASEDYYFAVAPEFLTFALALLAFGLYNLILFPWYYKNPQKVNWPQIVALISAMLVMGLGIALEMMLIVLLPEAFKSHGSLYWGVQLGSLAFGVLCFALMSYIAEYLAEKRFEKVDL